MGLPLKLKDMVLTNYGRAYLGDVPSVTMPKLARKFEEWRGAGMDGPVKIDMGGEALDMEWSAGGPLKDVLSQFGATTVDATFLRFTGAYQADDTEDHVAVEITVRGRHEEIDPGEQKVGEGGEFKMKTACSYYRLEWNGETVIEIDRLARLFMVNGIDILAQRRAILGM